jgi:hypothetical protein
MRMNEGKEVWNVSRTSHKLILKGERYDCT